MPGGIDVFELIEWQKRALGLISVPHWRLLVRFWLRLRDVECFGGLQRFHRYACVRVYHS